MKAEREIGTVPAACTANAESSAGVPVSGGTVFEKRRIKAVSADNRNSERAVEILRNKRLMMLLIAVILFIGGLAVSGINARKARLEEERRGALEEQAKQEVRSVTLTAAGDCTLATDITTPIENSFESKVEELGGDYSYFLKNFLTLFSEDDLTIVNFEGTLSENGERQDKQFAFRGKPEYTQILTSASVEAANLANNHSRDYGEVSLEDTKDALTNAGIINFIGDDIKYTDISGI